MSFSPKRRYSAVAVFSEDLERVVLIHKLKPDWQAGKANLPGGKVDVADYTHADTCKFDFPNLACCKRDGDAQADAFLCCARRELREETGLDVAATALQLFCRLRFKTPGGDDAECCFYAARGDVDVVRTMEAERVFVEDCCEVWDGRAWYSSDGSDEYSSPCYRDTKLSTMSNLPYLIAMARQCLRGEGAGAWPLTIYEAGATP